MNHHFKAYLRHKKNNDLYCHIEGEKYLNVRTNKEWDIPDEIESDIFILNTSATLIINEYPLVGEFIHRLGLKIEGSQ